MGLGMLGALGGLGDAGMQIGGQMMQSALRQDYAELLAKERESLAKAQEAAQIRREQREQDRKMAPINRANDAVKQALGVEVPMEAEDVTQLTGNESASRQGTGMLAGAYRGDPKQIVQDISRIKNDDEKRMAAEALESQLQDAKKANQDAVAGKTRRLSREDAMSLAERSLDGDIEAQAALKAARGDKYTKVGANETILDKNGRVVFQNKQGEENLKAMFENKLELVKATEKLKAELGAKTGEMPSDAKMAEWLVRNGVAPDMKSAYERVKQGRDKDDVAIQASIFSALKQGGAMESPDVLWNMAGKMVGGSRAAESGKPVVAEKPKLDTLFPVRK